MEYLVHDTTYLVRLDKDEAVIATLTQFCIQQAISCATLTAIGAVDHVTCGHYDLVAQEYRMSEYDELVEVVSCAGNVALKEGVPLLHCHAVFSRPGNETFAGHVTEMQVGATFEVVLRVVPRKVKRTYDPETGLFLLSLEDEFSDV